MRRHVTSCALLLAIEYTAVFAFADNFPLVRVDTSFQSSGAVGLLDAVWDNSLAPAGTSNAQGNSPSANYDETTAASSNGQALTLGGATASVSVVTTADMPVPWSASTYVPEATISVGASTICQNTNAWSNSAAFWEIDSTDPVLATGTFEIQSIPGYPDIEDGALTGAIDIILSYGRTGDGDSGFANGQQLGIVSAGYSTFSAQCGSSFVTGTRNPTNNGWIVTGTVFDENGDSAELTEYLADNVNEIIGVAEPVSVGDTRSVSASTDIGGASGCGPGTEQAMWGLSIASWFEVTSN